MKLIIIFIFHLSFFISFSQEVNFDSGKIKQKKYFEEIEIEMEHGHIIVPVTINNKKYRFLLDTGAPNLISKKLFNELNLKNTKEINILDSSNLTQKMEQTIVPKLQIGNLEFENQTALVFDIQNHDIFKCYNIDGFIGSNLLKNSIIKISTINNKIILTDQIKLLNIKTKPSKLELISPQKSPFIKLNLKGNNNINATDFVLIDTGMCGFYDISNRGYNILKESSIFHEVSSSEGVISMGINGIDKPSNQKLLYLKELKINNSILKNIMVETTNDNNSRIGIDFLKYGDLTIDFKNEKVYFESENIITLNSKVSRLNPIIIDKKLVVGIVWDNELKKNIDYGDEIISINSILLKDLNICEIFNLRNKWIKEENFIIEIKNKKNEIIKINKYEN